ncbi:Zn(II)2Cys6 transcription factor [Aspergillus affinis]|uniref:Zn(II)2Cys6 transcription factor n=1 Tax=Aspergillus affinis TaxID=1070780 RepID=UPI0022FF26CF|nr:uncharacterized protein KD926_001046 [Aspergillus affinis]KAI9044445.1 hypothetical protein KD926_001046 [Aspergillus affinis]
MEAPSSLPQPEDGHVQGEMVIRPRADDSNEVVSTSNPPSLPGTSSQAPQKLQLASRSSHMGRKQLISNAKVAIPRQRTSSTNPRYPRRVPLACETCRQRKTKCSGDTPVCRQCRELRVECKYPVSWRERTKGQLDKLEMKTQEYENLLKEIGNIVDGRTAERIRNTLDKWSARDDSTSSSQSNSLTPQDEDQELDDVSSVSSIGSLEAIDRVEEDLNRTPSSRATGYMGKNSEITWMQRLRKEAESRSRRQPGAFEAEHDGEFALHAMNYHLDDMDVSVPGPVQAYWMPPRPLADKLFEDYLDTIHPFFPIISRSLFRTQYNIFYDSAARPGDKWLAILNMIFAIASKHAHLTQAPWRGQEKDHLVYLTRARILSMDGNTLFSHPDLQQVQVEGLVAFYLLSTDQINRAWRIAALAVRSSISLGLNMKNTSQGTANISKEARYKVWWCLYTFEHMLGIMTGRASCISDGICTTPLPLPFEENELRDPSAAKLLGDLTLRQEYVDAALASSCVRQVPLNPLGGRDARHTDKIRDSTWLRSQPPSKALIFLYYVDLAVIVQEIVNRVYSLDSTMVPWSHIENRMGELRSRVDLWQSSLPEAFDFTRFAQKDDEDLDVLRGKLFLAFHFYSARITLGRPCLCRRDARQQAPHEKSTFSHDMAIVTLESAHMMLGLIPDMPDALRLYKICPWWCILHYLMQAVTVLLLELSFGCIHVPADEHRILLASKKGVRWLFAMAQFSLPSRRAWELCIGNLRRIAIGMNYDLTDMPSSDDELESYRESVNNEKVDMSQATMTSMPPPTNVNTSASGEQPMVSAPSQAPVGYSQNQNDSTVDLRVTMPPSNAYLFSGSDIYFPYDPISSEFIRSFFPASNDEESWHQ